MSKNQDINKAYISPIDKFLLEFDATHTKSASQLIEILKHQRIAYMRDNKDYKKDAGDIWEAF